MSSLCSIPQSSFFGETKQQKLLNFNFTSFKLVCVCACVRLWRAALLNSSTLGKLWIRLSYNQVLHTFYSCCFKVKTLKLNRTHTHNAGVAHQRAKRPTNGLSADSCSIRGNRITIEKPHNKGNQLYFASRGSRKKKMWRQVVDNDISQTWKTTDCKKKTLNGFFLIAQWHNLPFMNTSTFVEA